MKKTLLLGLFITAVGFSGLGAEDFGTLTFTNKSGKVYTNALVTSVSQDRVIWRDGASGGSVRLTDLPAAVQKRFGYDSAKAANVESQRADNAALRREAFAKAKDEALRTAELKKKTDEVEAARRLIAGSILQVLDDGILVRHGTMGNEIIRQAQQRAGGRSYGSLNTELVMITEVDTSNLVDGANARAWVYPLGTYSYTSVGGGMKTIKKYTMNKETALRAVQAP